MLLDDDDDDGHTGASLPLVGGLVDGTGLNKCILAQMVLLLPCLPGKCTSLPIRGSSHQPHSGPLGLHQLMKYVAITFADKGLDALFYLDNWLLTLFSWLEVKATVCVASEAVGSMGFTFNIPKFSLVPQQCLIWLGIVWDTVTMTLALFPDNLLWVHLKLL